MTTSGPAVEPICYAKRERPEAPDGDDDNAIPTSTHTFTFVERENLDSDPD